MRSRRLRLLVLLVPLTVGVASLALGCGSGDADGVKTYKDTDYGYSFEYPAGWKLAKSDGAEVTSGADPAATVSVGDPKGAKVGDTGLDLIMIRVYELGQSVDKSMLPDVLPYLEGLLADLQSQDPSWKLEEPLAETTVGGAPGYQATFSFDWDADTPVKTTSYFVFAGSTEYQLMVQAATENWEKDQAVFAAFIASFKPGTSVQ